jgi:hypothetical protein
MGIYRNRFILFPNFLFVLLFLLLAVFKPINTALAAEQTTQQVSRVGQLIQKSTLFKLPNNQSKKLAIVDANQSITILRRQRAYYQVATQEPIQQRLSGWVKMLNVRFLAVAKRQSELGVSALFSSITNDSKATVSTGIRGFDENDLANAKANMQQVELLATYAVTDDLALQFAEQGRLPVSAVMSKNKKAQQQEAK